MTDSSNEAKQKEALEISNGTAGGVAKTYT